MSRAGLICLLALAAAAAEPVALPAAADAVQSDAAHQLEAARTRIADERSHLLVRLRDATTAADAARKRLDAAGRAGQAAGAELDRLRRERARDDEAMRQVAERALAAAHLSEEGIAAHPPAEQVDAAVAALERRAAALPQRLGWHLGPEAVVGRDGVIAETPVLRLGEARAIALGDSDARRGLLRRNADGSWLVDGPLLPASIRSRDGAVAWIPLDASGQGVQTAAAPRRTLKQWLAGGRFFIWPIIVVLAIGLILVVERTCVLWRRRMDHGRLLAVAGHLARDEAPAAAALVAGGGTPLDRVLRAGIEARGRQREEREALVEQALLAETAQFTRGLTAIAVLAGVAPLLGLLGTVTGMIDMFAVIAHQGSGNAKSLSGGISEALICTQAGMMVAIPLLLAHAWLARAADRRTLLLEEAACGILGLGGATEAGNG